MESCLDACDAAAYSSTAITELSELAQHSPWRVEIEANPGCSVKIGRQLPLFRQNWGKSSLCSPRKIRAAAAQVKLDLRSRRVRLKLYDCAIFMMNFLNCYWAIFMMIFYFSRVTDLTYDKSAPAVFHLRLSCIQTPSSLNYSTLSITSLRIVIVQEWWFRNYIFNAVTVKMTVNSN